MTDLRYAVFSAGNYCVSETLNMKTRPARTTDPYSRAFRLQPYVRVAGADWRGPWFIAERRIMDYLLVYIDQGTGRFTLEGEAFDVKPGDVIWFPPKRLHELRGHPPKMHVLYVHFDLLYDPDRSPRARVTQSGERDLGAESRWIHPPLKDPVIDAWCGKLPVVNASAIHSLIWQVYVEAVGGREPLLLSGLMLQIIGELTRGLSPVASRAGEHWPALQRSAETILRAAGEELDVTALAQDAHLSVSHFRRLFHEVHHKSPREFHDFARAQKACEMILHSGQNMTAIARELGFSTVHNFSRAFKRQIGVSPRAFKRRTVRRA